MSPDEHFIGNNDLYTNLLAQFCVDNYAPGKGLFMLPRDEKSLLTYDGDKVKSYKQAAAVLSIYPLQNPEAEKNAKVMMSRFSDKVIKNGPAMTDSIHSIIYARMGQPEDAYQAWHRSWKDFADHPLMLFSEKRNSERTYFTTGAGGCLQAVLFGFAGLRIDTEIPAGFKKIADLKSGYVLSAKPNLPKAWKSMRIRGLTVLGSKGDLIIEGDQVSFSSKLTP
jgi:trehalose/maltose hydrolase-like predicted phosphorylase